MKSLNQSDFSEAIRYFTLVLEKDPNNVEAHYNMAVAYKKQGEHEKSLKHFDKVVELLNSPAGNNNNIFNVSKFKQNRQRMDSIDDESLDKYSAYNDIKEKENDYIDLGDMHADNGQYQTAVEYFSLALQINPYNDNTYYKISNCYMELEDYLEAEPYINKAVELDPDNTRYKYYQNVVSGKIDSEYGYEVKRREKIVMKESIEENSFANDEKTHYKRDLYKGEWVSKETNSGLDSNGIALEPPNNRRSEIKQHYQNNSINGFDRFANNQSQELDYIDLGDLHFDNLDYEAALEYYRAALDVNPNNDYSYYKISRCYIELGEYSKADENIEKALSLSGKNNKYVYFKNEITDRVANKNVPEDEFYSPQREREDYRDQMAPYYVDEIAQEPDDDFLKPRKSILGNIKSKMKSGISAVKKTKLPKISLTWPSSMNPLEGKVEKYSDRRREKFEHYTPKSNDYMFNRSPDYYGEPPPIQDMPNQDYTAQQNEFGLPTQQPQEVGGMYSAQFYNQKGIEFYKRDILDKAEDYFKKAIQLKPMYARGYNNLANVEFKRRNFEKAKEYAIQAITIDPKFPEGYYNLASISKKMGEFKAEIDYLNQAIIVDPKYYEAYFARGLAYYRQGNNEKAKYNFSEVLRFKNNHFLASQNLGIVFANELNYTQAEKYLNRAVKLNQDNSKTYFHLGVVRKSLGKVSFAIEDLQKSIELDPNNYAAYVALSKCHMKNSEPERAINILKKATVKSPENAEIYNYLGLLSLKFDRYEEACQAFKKAVEKNPKRPIYYYNLSQCYLCLGDREKSNNAFQRGVSIIPDSIQDYSDLAQIFFDRGMSSYAITVLKEGIGKLKNNDYLYLVLSDFYEKTGAAHSSIDILQDYLKKKPKGGAFSLLVKKRLAKLESL